jgi:hypothetical protein
MGVKLFLLPLNIAPLALGFFIFLAVTMGMFLKFCPGLET